MLTILLLVLPLMALATERPAVDDFKAIEGARITRLDAAGGAQRDAMTFGNLADPTVTVDDWYYGSESIAYPIKSGSVTGPCPGGFQPLGVTSYFRFGPEDVPVEFYVRGAVCMSEEVTPGCNKPGERVVETPMYTMSITEPGDYEITLPFDEAAPVTINGEGPWFVEFNFPLSFADGMFPSALIDDSPIECSSWYNFFVLGWEDLVVDYGWPGSVIVRLDAECLAGVPAADESWSGLKAMFD